MKVCCFIWHCYKHQLLDNSPLFIFITVTSFDHFRSQSRGQSARERCSFLTFGTVSNRSLFISDAQWHRSDGTLLGALIIFTRVPEKGRGCASAWAILIRRKQMCTVTDANSKKQIHQWKNNTTAETENDIYSECKYHLVQKTIKEKCYYSKLWFDRITPQLSRTQTFAQAFKFVLLEFCMNFLWWLVATSLTL